MKQAIVAVLLVFGVFGPVRAQFHGGNMELTLIGGGGSISRDHSGSSSSSSSSETIITVSAMPAIFITNGLSFEPEIQLYLESPSNSSGYTAVSFTGCLAYTFQTGTSTLPFLRAGYGTGSGVQFPIYGGLLIPFVNDDNVSVSGPYLGGGVKVLLARQVALRLELGWRGQNYTSGTAPYSSDYSFSTIAMRFGFSFLTIGGGETAPAK